MPTVEVVTAQLANATLNSDKPAANGNTAQNDAANVSAAEGRRLYIGNLAYATTERELKNFFNDYMVESTSIPTNPRNNRPVGYAFVDLATAAEAERAIQQLSNKSILDRTVSLQLARKPDATGEGAASGGEGTANNNARRRASQRGRGRGRGGRSARGGRNNQKSGGDQAKEGDASNVSASVQPFTDVTNTQLTTSKDADGEKSGDNAKGPPKNRVPRERKQRGPPEDGVPSKTKIMVANLPYDLGEEKLLEIFKNYFPCAARIALRPIPRFMVKKLQARGEQRKGRGFGFITLATEEMQQKACEEMNGKVIEGREIAVKVAIDSPGKDDNASATNNIDEASANIENKVPSTLSGAGEVAAAA